MEDRKHTVDIGVERILMPATRHLVTIQPQSLFRAERLFIEERFGVTIDNAKVGNQDQHWYPCSTLFYSVPSNPKTIDKIQAMIREAKGVEPDYSMLDFVWDDEADPESAMGLPVRWDTAEVGNTISMLFSNKSCDPVRIVVVLRGTTVM